MENWLERADWIWHDEQPTWNETVDLLASFTVSDPAACRVYISVNSHYALYVNGAFWANDQFPDYENWKVYDEISLSGIVHLGENRLCVSAYWQGDGSLTYRPFAPGALFAVYEGERLLAASGADTQTRRNQNYAAAGVEKITGQLSYSFRYDATVAPGVTRPAKVCGYHWPLHPRPVRRLRLDPPEPVTVAVVGHADTPAGKTTAERMQAAAITAAATDPRPLLPNDGALVLRDNFVLLDLGKEQVGYFSLDIDLATEGDILIGWGEHLEDLRVRTAIAGRCFAALYHGRAGRNQFFYPFKRMGLRYLQLHLPGGGAILHYAGIRPARYPLQKVNLFTCADRLHSQIYRTSLRTLLHCMHDHYEDCPWREQGLYTMDSRNQMLCGYYTFEEYDFARASLRQFALGLRDDHTLELTSPGQADITIPSFTVIFLIQLGEYLRYSDDEGFVREVLPAALDIAEGLLARIEDNGLIRRFEGAGYWNFYEWQTGLAGKCGAETPADQQAFDAPLAAFASMGLQHLSAICARLQRMEAAARYAAAADRLNEAINATFWQPDKGWYATTLEAGHLTHACELTQALAVCCGAVPRARLERVLATLTGGMGPDFYPVTISHSIFKYEALLRLPAVYGRYVFGHLADTFGAMLYKDATTFWETAEGALAFDKAGSLCHAWSAIPSYFYLRYCLDSRGEGTRLTPAETGIYEPQCKAFWDASRRIVDDNWQG